MQDIFPAEVCPVVVRFFNARSSSMTLGARILGLTLITRGLVLLILVAIAFTVGANNA